MIVRPVLLNKCYTLYQSVGGDDNTFSSAQVCTLNMIRVPSIWHLQTPVVMPNACMVNRDHGRILHPVSALIWPMVALDETYQNVVSGGPAFEAQIKYSRCL